MTKKLIYKLPPQESAEDTSNWDDRAFTIRRPASTANGKPSDEHAIMEPDNPYEEDDID